MHVTTVNLLASSNFTEKRIAYSALSLLLDERSEVLLLSTQTIKKDLESPNFSIIAMALNAIGEICTADMCRELATEVTRLMQNPNSYIKKKAACACSKIVRKCPELIDSFVKPLFSYFEERNHGVVLSGLSLMVQIFKIEPSLIKKFTRFMPFVIKHLKNLIAISYSPEYDVNGITDPFLQAKLLESLQYFGKDNRELSEEMRDILSSVSSSTEGSKNTGISILYELVRTINGIEADTALKSLSSTILGKLLVNRDSNYKYIALNTLREVVKLDLATVQKHKNTILECLKDNDISIKRRALDLTYLIINSSNIKQIVKECLNFLLKCEDEIKLELTAKICQSLDKYSPSLKWQIDTLIKMLCISNNFITEDTVSTIINVILSSENLKLYSVHKCFIAIKNNPEQEALAKVSVYIIGEFGDLLVNNPALGPDDEHIIVTEDEVLRVLSQIEQINYSTSTVQEYLMNAYVKLSTKFSAPSVSKINACLQEETRSEFYEVQQRSVEYVTFGKILNGEIRKEITKHVPLSTVDRDHTKDKSICCEEEDEEAESKESEERKLIIKFSGLNGPSTNSGGGNLLTLTQAGQLDSLIPSNINSKPNTLNLLDIFGSTGLNLDITSNNFNNNIITPNTITIDSGTSKNSPGLMTDLLGAYGSSNNINSDKGLIDLSSAYNTNPNPNLFDLGISSSNGFNTNGMDISSSSSAPLTPMKEVHRNSDITICYTYNKNVDGSFTGSFYVSNLTPQPINNINLKFMVLKFVTLKVLATSGVYLEPYQLNGIKKVKLSIY